MSELRVYSEVGRDGYPPEWHATIKHVIREIAGYRCERCGHPYRNGEHGNGEWSPCDDRCSHTNGRFRVRDVSGSWIEYDDDPSNPLAALTRTYNVQAQWRILTVHHLNGNKADCRWWNLAALCQRCHLRIQRVVDMNRVWPWAHSTWFEIHAAGWYAHAYLGEDLTRQETVARLDELLALERVPEPAKHKKGSVT